MTDVLDILLVCAPGFEDVLASSARAHGFAIVKTFPGGVEVQGNWAEVWRANLVLRGASRVLVRLASFRAPHLAVLDKRAKRVPWATWFPQDVGIKVEVTCKRSKIYHAKAAAQRIESALQVAGLKIGETITLKARIEDDLCVISVDSSGEPLHRRGHKEFVGKAPMRETMAAMFLAECGFTGNEPVVDPMCGSGTFVIEAAEISLGLLPGRTRTFAFQNFANFRADVWQKLHKTEPNTPNFMVYGFDRDDSAVRGAHSNAQRAGVAEQCVFQRQAISELARPDGPPGLVIVNPPYGARIGNRKLLFGLYGALGNVLKERFQGWRVGLVTSDNGLAKATGLPFDGQGPTVPHGPLKVTLWKTGHI